MKKLLMISLLLMLAIPALAAEKWQIVEAPEGAGAKWMANVSNAQGDTFNIWRKIVRIKFEAIGELTLNGPKLPKNVSVNYQVDGGQPVRLEVIEQKGNRLLWRVWSSTTNEISQDDALWYMARGNQIVFSWKDTNGTVHQHLFSLSGSGKALERIVASYN